MVTRGHMQDGVTINARCNTVQYSRSEFIIAYISLEHDLLSGAPWARTYAFVAHHRRAPNKVCHLEGRAQIL